MGTEKDSADKAKADVERVEAEEDEAPAKTGQRPAKPNKTDRPRFGNEIFGTFGRDFRTKDGRYIGISASIQAMSERLFRAIGREDMISDPRFRTLAHTRRWIIATTSPSGRVGPRLRSRAQWVR